MEKLRFWYPLAFFLLVLSGGIQCKKIKEDIARKFIIDAMTNGRWLVQVFKENDEDITEDFSDYEFQFERDGTVLAIKRSGQGQVTGNWEGDANELTIYSNFSGAGEPLLRLNDTWKITNNTMKLVEAEPFNSVRVAYLKLVKKE
ncbi:MAG: hypothetical protein M9933_14610 [Chitinophagaceae bacterium]|nr:hypothetical protein [Chitinophagaceae bacterium]